MDRYAPGYAGDVLAMLRSRGADRRAGFLLARLRPGRRVLDAGWGPGSIPLGLARAVAPEGLAVGLDREPSQLAAARAAAHVAGVRGVRFVEGEATAVPFADGWLDAALAHALLEHLPDPLAAVRELRRGVRPDGRVALCSSDWSRARVELWTPDVACALAGHRELRRIAGGDPDAGGSLPSLAARAGLELVWSGHELRRDVAYGELAGYVGARLEAAGRTAAAAAARRWQAAGDGTFEQHWVSVLARVPRGCG